MSDTIRLCVQTHHPIDPGPGSPGGREAMKHRGWADCDRAWCAWLASDEAVRRVADVIAAARSAPGEVVLLDRDEDEARAVLTALRGDET